MKKFNKRLMKKVAIISTMIIAANSFRGYNYVNKEVKSDTNIEIINRNPLEEVYPYEEFIKDQEIKEQQRQEEEKEQLKKKEEEEKLQDNTLTWDVSFYTHLADEGGGLGLTASGKPVAYGLVANNFLEFGTKIYIEGFGIFEVADLGNPYYFNTVNRLDMYIPKLEGEDDYRYKQRVLAMGVQEVPGYIIK